eukprot:1890716-Rhodomonas_salina.2
MPATRGDKYGTPVPEYAVCHSGTPVRYGSAVTHYRGGTSVTTRNSLKRVATVSFVATILPPSKFDKKSIGSVLLWFIAVRQTRTAATNVSPAEAL